MFTLIIGLESKGTSKAMPAPPRPLLSRQSPTARAHLGAL